MRKPTITSAQSVEMDAAFRVFRATPDLGSASSFALSQTNAFVSTQEIQVTHPGGQLSWHVSGPQGAQVEIILSREINSGGHEHVNGPTGAISPSVFALTDPYPQNVICLFRASDRRETLQNTDLPCGLRFLYAAAASATSGSNSTSNWPCDTMSPTVTWILCTSPVNGAVSVW